MKINKAGLDLIKRFEGCKLKAYKCPAGAWTIGYGHTAGVYEGMTITQAQADDFLKSDMVQYENYVNRYCGHLALNSNEFSALVSFTYNCGLGNLKLLIKNRDKAAIAEAMLMYNKAAGKVLNGLVKRRKAERELFLTPVVSVTYLKKYTGSSQSLVDALKGVGADSSYAYRKKLAAANGVTLYVGAPAQNLKLLELLKQGKLIKA